MSDALAAEPLRVLVIDDSAANRRSIAKLLEAADDIEVVARAGDGEEGLRHALTLLPDVITLDLDMPKLDGYAFLRLLMARVPTPVVVVSSYNHPTDVFKALQLGAFDFVAKPNGRASYDSMREVLIEKVRSARFVRLDGAPVKKAPLSTNRSAVGPTVVAIGASTGGPPAVQKVLEALVGRSVCVLVAQHMPPRFTAAFAQRLDAALPFRVTEARSGDLIRESHVYIAPGGTQMRVLATAGQLSLNVVAAGPNDVHAPSVDVLFKSLAKYVGDEAKAVVLSGMGDDGAEGVRALGQARAELWAEDETSAVVFGMPAAAIDTGFVTHALPIDALSVSLARTIERTEKSRRP